MCETFKQFNQIFGEEDNFEGDFFFKDFTGGGLTFDLLFLQYWKLLQLYLHLLCT